MIMEALSRTSWLELREQSQKKEGERQVRKNRQSQVLVAHAYNPSFSGSRDQEDRGSKQSPSKQFPRPYLKNT
jgi:hypothetical protein